MPTDMVRHGAIATAYVCNKLLIFKLVDTTDLSAVTTWNGSTAGNTFDASGNLHYRRVYRDGTYDGAWNSPSNVGTVRNMDKGWYMCTMTAGELTAPWIMVNASDSAENVEDGVLLETYGAIGLSGNAGPLHFN